nr:YcnI family protein [Micromonospora sp. DSM 115978]
MNTALRTLLRAGVVTGAAGGLVALAALPAAAHVTVTPSVTAAGSYTVLTFSVPHGCDGAGTTKVAIQIPEQINAVTPTINQGWTVEKVKATLDPPVKDSHGNELTERVAEIVYTAKTPLPEGHRDAFELSLRLPETPDETLAFPTVQTCEQGETAWVQLPAAGQDSGDLDAPAPMFVVTAAAGDGHGAAEAEAAPEPVAQESSTDDPGAAGSAAGWTGLVLGALGFVLGGVAFIRTRKTA